MMEECKTNDTGKAEYAQLWHLFYDREHIIATMQCLYTENAFFHGTQLTAAH